MGTGTWVEGVLPILALLAPDRPDLLRLNHGLGVPTVHAPLVLDQELLATLLVNQHPVPVHHRADPLDLVVAAQEPRRLRGQLDLAECPLLHLLRERHGHAGGHAHIAGVVQP